VEIMRQFLKALPLGVGLPLAIGAASVKPEDAASNLSGWAHLFGIHNPPDWLLNPNIDHKVIYAAFAISAVYAFLVWGVPAILHGAVQSRESASKTFSSAKQASQPALPPPPPRPKINLKGRTLVEATPRDLIGFYRGRTHLQGDSLLQPFIGKWILVFGPLKDVTAPETRGERTWQMIAMGMTDDRTDLIFLHFTGRHEKLATLMLGQNIWVLGRIESADNLGVHLADCELVEE
jgi:hypothetical protein